MDTLNRYEIALRPPTGEIYSDVIYMAVFRIPIVKNASFAVMRINIPAVQFQMMQLDISKNKFPQYKIMIYMVDKDNKKTQFIAYKSYKILSCSPLEKVDMTKPDIHAQLLLLNPVFHQMEAGLSYNKILENMKPYDVILDYEKHIKEIYGDCFDSRHYVDEKIKNDYKYEQILTFTQNDLSVPSFIIDSCKPTHVSSFYFFDDFSLCKETQKDIICYLINPSNKSKFTKFDLSKYADIEYGTIKLGKIDFTDPFYERLKASESSVFQEKENSVDYKKSKSASPIQERTSNSSSNDFENFGGRGISLTTHTLQTKVVKQPIQYQNIYVPDNIDKAKKRLEEYKKLVTERIDKIELFETRNCIIDWLQFGRIYNLIKDNRSAYIYTPISIVNIFTRENEKEFYLRHSAKYTMLKYFD